MAADEVQLPGPGPLAGHDAAYHRFWTRSSRLAPGQIRERTTPPSDYGCGWGRTSLIDRQRTPPLYAVIPGTKPSAHAGPTIAVNFAQCLEVPTAVPFPGVTFDLIYAYSVFTHLSEDTCKAVLGAFREALRPGGMAVITVRPQTYWDAHSQEQSAVDVERMKADHETCGFAFTPHNRPPIDGHVRYGDTSISVEYMAKVAPVHWSARALDTTHPPGVPAPVSVTSWLASRSRVPADLLPTRRTSKLALGASVPRVPRLGCRISPVRVWPACCHPPRRRPRVPALVAARGPFARRLRGSRPTFTKTRAPEWR